LNAVDAAKVYIQSVLDGLPSDQSFDALNRVEFQQLMRAVKEAEDCAPPPNNITDYWMAHYTADSGLCSLCGNSGRIDTSGARSSAGVMAGRVNFCICPNGQAIRKASE